MTRCYEKYWLVECKPDVCDISSERNQRYMQEYMTFMKGYGVKFNNTPEDKELFTALRAEHGTERAYIDKRHNCAISPPPPPEGLFNTIVVDPPWPFFGKSITDDRGSIYTRLAKRPYHVMTMQEIHGLEIPAADDCVLWLWVPNRNIHAALHVLETWGFDFKTILTWAKDKMGLGYWLRGQTEQCLLATKGSPIWSNTKETTLLEAPRREDSRKPDRFYELIDRICSGPKIDMFSREKRDGWDQWGDEVDKF